MFQTSDWTVQNSVMLHDTVIMSGYPHTLSADELKAKLPEKHQKGIEKVSSDRVDSRLRECDNYAFLAVLAANSKLPA